ncbi:hypothetical protein PAPPERLAPAPP_04830 [Brevundimonas phage vB_BpoS-Papperlapapp]|uniref:Uncharacterized protein n=2 Tax=Marchewkavirus TaxID=3425052 RepID=A0A9E7SLU5_9CAUD|nr:hypothetical protein KABACHOK_03210 [Brevundimonas phage vB_BpoS-Kabachok]USN14852.1 hypothetical protein DOMOVOI_03780 [Brevundimonas phage vB_BpoS-Domovoi]USN16224.1 hypothetical protein PAPPERLAPAPP_04830 [Brevundimonas phage vB_BpoS-Papperlapapp]
MPDAPTLTPPARRATAPAKSPGRPARAASARPAKTAAVAPTPPILSPEDFRLIGSTLNGDHWQADIAKAIGCSKSQVTRYLNKSRDLNPPVARHLQFILTERIVALAKLMNLHGMPYAGLSQVDEAVDAITTALEPLPGQQPPREV